MLEPPAPGFLNVAYRFSTGLTQSKSFDLSKHTTEEIADLLAFSIQRDIDARSGSNSERPA